MALPYHMTRKCKGCHVLPVSHLKPAEVTVLNCSCCITGLFNTGTQEGSIYLFHMHQLTDVPVIDSGEKACHSSHPGSMADGPKPHVLIYSLQVYVIISY